MCEVVSYTREGTAAAESQLEKAIADPSLEKVRELPLQKRQLEKAIADPSLEKVRNPRSSTVHAVG
jgi:hypothetical protein